LLILSAGNFLQITIRWHCVETALRQKLSSLTWNSWDKRYCHLFWCILVRIEWRSE